MKTKEDVLEWADSTVVTRDALGEVTGTATGGEGVAARLAYCVRVTELVEKFQNEPALGFILEEAKNENGAR